ncbi:MAG: hypothetical protein Q4C97_08560 [Bacillota bacterium]|nr:hypothetical protein [Bacillota bacterium]
MAGSRCRQAWTRESEMPLQIAFCLLYFDRGKSRCFFAGWELKCIKETCMEGNEKYDREIILSGFLDERILRKSSGMQGM